MDKKLRIGIIGCGGIANGKHMPSLKELGNVEMVAFCDIIEERAVKAAEKFGTEDAKVYTDYKELLKDETIDVCHVCTPNRSHGFITVDALEAGKHVMCEKPMAKTYEDAKAMLEAAFPTGASFAKSRPHYVEMSPEGVNKGAALLRLARHFGIERDEVMAFGDGQNDVEMLKAAGTGVCMENGCPEAKAVADRIAPSNLEDGVAQVIEEYLDKGWIGGMKAK